MYRIALKDTTIRNAQSTRMFQSKSQAGQDEFVYRILKKTDGRFFDVGSHDPISINNTYALETLGWRGYMFDINPAYGADTNRKRVSKFTVADLTTIDWDTFLSENDIVGHHFDYMSFDIDEASLPALRRFPFDKISFTLCTLEHDKYRFGQAVADEMRDIMTSKGYSILCKDVKHDNFPYEDWYIRTDMKDIANGFYCESMEWSDVIKNVRNSFQ